MGCVRGRLILLCAVLAAMLLSADYAQAARPNKSIGYGALHPKQCHGNSQSPNCRKVPANPYTRGCHGNAKCRGGKKGGQAGNMKPKLPGLEENEFVQFATAWPAPAPAPVRFFHFWGA